MTTAPENDKDRVGERRTGDLVVDTARTVGDSLARIGVAAVDEPLRLAPEDLRHNVHDATSNLFTAVSRLHLRLVESTVDAVRDRRTTASADSAVDTPAEPRSRVATTAGGSARKQDG
jgi:hypothetical protein